MRIYKNNLFFKIMLLLFLFFPPQQLMAARSDAGGGKIEEFDTGKFITSTAISLGSIYIGNAISSGMNASSIGSKGFEIGGDFVPKGAPGVATFGQGFSNSLSSLGSVGGFANNLGTTMALQQVGNTVGAIGSYYDWNPKTTLFVSSVAQGFTQGGLGFDSTSFAQNTAAGTLLLDSTHASVKNSIDAAILGGIEGAVEGGISVSFANKQGRVEPWVGLASGAAGSFTAGLITQGLTTGTKSTDYDPAHLKAELDSGIISYRADKHDPGTFSFTNMKNFDWKKGVDSGVSNAVRSIPSRVVSMSVGYATKDMKWQDRQIVESAIRGAYPVVNNLTNLQSNNIYFERVSQDAVKQQLKGPTVQGLKVNSSPDKDKYNVQLNK